MLLLSSAGEGGSEGGSGGVQLNIQNFEELVVLTLPQGC